jgi:nucleoside-diphosphate-sugar epimerase
VRERTRTAEREETMKEPASASVHVIFGTGPVGCWIARFLRELNIPVRAVNRSGRRPDLMPADVEIVAADVSDTAQAITAAKNAVVLYQALNPPYHQWHKYFPGLQTAALTAAKAAGARYVSIENLYMYDSSKPINEDSRLAPRSKKGELRARMAGEVIAAHAREEILACTLRSSDYFGPGVLGSSFGEMVFGNLLSGKKAQVGGSADRPHSFAYIEDVGRAAALLGTRKEAVGKIWIAPHAPALTQREMVAKACQVLKMKPQMTVVSPLMMRIAGLFIPNARASVEMMYEFTEPFVVDSHRMQNTFGLQPTPADTAIDRTMDWYKKRIGRN